MKNKQIWTFVGIAVILSVLLGILIHFSTIISSLGLSHENSQPGESGSILNAFLEVLVSSLVAFCTLMITFYIIKPFNSSRQIIPRLNLLAILTFCGLIFIPNNSYAQYKSDRSQDSDPDTAWVSPNRSVPSFATYQLYPTPERGKDTFGSFMIYLPEEYKNTSNRYPVIYYLHGGNGNQREGKWLMNEIDKAIKDQIMPPVIIVSVQALPIGWYCNANIGAKGVISGSIENVIIKNLVPYIDAHYRTIATSSGRGLEGWSMGGFGAIRLAFKYPELFGFTSSIAGALIEFQDEHNPQYLVNTFGPSTGAGSEKSEDYFNAIHPKYYACKNAEMIKSNVKIRLIVGDQDWLYNNNGKLITNNFSQYLDSLGIKHEYTVIKNVGHMIPIEFANGNIKYPVKFWVDAFKPNF